jgi:hypothetical protein
MEHEMPDDHPYPEANIGNGWRARNPARYAVPCVNYRKASVRHEVARR